ncbi:protein N-acetyltransferase, RimJ/RimL family [Lentimicrobium saccharophilum]|uniref:Protein N-acetyltransferase, RimJ/RimL family n=1 Tax=Lentimicrobium saccharophilum TaxID=1678841 RepID=A0A0S7C2A7_9BACT|nr:GNAT family N-acetyltransferase [Lentimicrobium saccharophilum]GAP44754.1 protein N-acetyltransferase, RimJ/RimL family [Lentimicrobium saccharophilum]
MIGKKIRLRAPEPADIDILYHWENDPEIWHVSNTSAPYSRFAIEQYVLNAGHDIFNSRQLRLMIVTLESESVAAGAIDLFDYEPIHSRAGVGIMIGKAFRGKGYASEALALILDYCRNILNLHQVYCNISEDNAASIRLFDEAGFRKNGEKKEWLLLNGKWTNEFFYQLFLK